MPLLTHRAAAAFFAAAAAAALAPACASADSLVFIKADNVWLSASDGSKLTQVTTDGTSASPYRSPSQADDGTIAASKDHLIVRLRQNGEVINTVDPPELRTSASTPIDGVPVSVAISPDGTKIAFQYATYNCPIGASCMARSATGITWADRATPASQFATTYFTHPRWVGNGRLVVGGGYLSHANLVDIAGGSEPVHWFDDQDTFDPSSDLSHTSVSRDGTRVIAIHGYDSEQETSKQLVWFKATADPRTAPLPPAKPEGLCVSNVLRGYSDPVWSPSADDLAFALPEGIHVARAVPRAGGDACAGLKSTLVHPGASEPDWGPANVNPGPRTTPPGSGGTPGGTTKPPAADGTTRPGGGTSGAAGTVAHRGKASVKAVTSKGARLKLAALPANTKVTVKLTIDKNTAKRAGLGRKAKTVGKRTVTTSKSGSASLTVRLDRAAAKRLKRLKKLTLTVQVPGAASTTLNLK